MSPVRNQPSSPRTSALAASLCQYPEKMLSPFSRISPSSAIRTDTPGIGRPTVPIFSAPSRLRQAPAAVSVSPYPSYTVIPMPRKKWPSRAPSGAPPDIAARHCPPSAAGVQRLAVGDRDLFGQVEDAALAVGVRALLGGVVDLLEHPGHRQHER